MSGGWFRDNLFSSQAPKYHGLVNQGATSYLNSVLQVLFMTKDFREAVESSTDENPESIDRHLRSLFGDLQKYSAYTYKITKALGINTVYEQRDAAEYIEKILRLTSDGASQVFHGLVSQRTTCCKCKTKTDRDEAFWHLPLALVDSCSDVYSVVDGVTNFFRVSDFSGGQIYCDSCDDKADATAQYVMKHHPDVLILLLKRFEFDYQYMSYVKISCDVDVPSTIQIPERQMYKLYAVVDHSGDLRGGHYTATINDEDEDRWYNFNDSIVTPCDDQPFKDNEDNMKRSQTAQLLFYRKMEEADNMSTNHNICEDAEKTRQRDEGEDDANTKDHTAVAVSAGENEATGNEDVVRDVCRGVGLSEEADNEGNVNQTGTHKNQEDNEERSDDYQDGSVNMQKIEVGTQREDDKEDIRRQAEADDQTQNVRLASVEIKQTESIKNETAEADTDSERRLNANFKPDVSDQPKLCDLPNQQDKTNNAQIRVMSSDKMTGDKESENPPMYDFNEDGLDKQNRNKGRDSSLTTGQHFDPEHMDKQEDEELKNDTEDNIERERRTHEFPSESVMRETKRPDPDKKHDGNENSDNGRFYNAQPRKSRNLSVEFAGVEVKDNEETVRCQIKKDKKVSCKDGTVGSSNTQSKPSDNLESKRDISHSLERHVEDKMREKNDHQRDGGHEQRRGSGRKGSESGKSKDSGRLDEGNGQKNVKKQAEEKEEKGDPEQFHNMEDSGQVGTVRGEIENQEKGSEQRRFHNKVQDNQPDVQHSVKDTGPLKTNKRKRPGCSTLSCIRIKKKRTGRAEKISNSSHDDQNTDSVTEGVSNLMLTESAVPESKKRKTLGGKKIFWKQHGEAEKKEESKENKKKITKHKTSGCFPLFSRGRKSIEQNGEED